MRRRHLLRAGLAFAAAPWLQPLAGSDPEREFKRALGRTSITLYPTLVREGRATRHHLDSARSIAAALEEQRLARTALDEHLLDIPLQPSFNQARMYRRTRDAFAGYVKAHQPNTPYAALAEYLITTRGHPAGIHFFVVRSDGTPVTGVLLNSHWKEFRQVKPASVQDATRALLLRLSNHWKPATS